MPKARKAQADCGVRFLSKPCLLLCLNDTASRHTNKNHSILFDIPIICRTFGIIITRNPIVRTDKTKITLWKRR